ncbi:ThuA domain-containing protein [Blastopirellula retiformator]|uniref:Trehalose utilization n=1 Tax=Blastopirellula retiformator TaxID=2527970 RepID=A0A5C5UWX9_9BACT|nr:ThuA domain-containing protein [Blastopirellula retiformator]TWT29885.1 Trehalose utilization [Blastopirellula retiformator]
MTSPPLRICIWNEYHHERENPDVGKLYADGIHNAVATFLREKLGAGAEVTTATLGEPEHGLTVEKLAATDVLYWWGHAKHLDVQDEIVDRVQQRVLEGMGLVVLHSGHDSKIFKRLLGTRCSLRWREAGERERLWISAPGHPIASGLSGEYFELPHAEMYGEYFDIPQPDDVIFISWFEGGEVFRSGCTFTRGAGKIFYFRPGHETYPIYYDANIQQVLTNAALWAKPSGATYLGECRNPTESLSPIEKRD